MELPEHYLYTIRVKGIGLITIHECRSIEKVRLMESTLHSTSLLTPQAAMIISHAFEPRHTGTLLIPEWPSIKIYTGGALLNSREAIEAALLIDGCPDCTPEDFSLPLPLDNCPEKAVLIR